MSINSKPIKCYVSKTLCFPIFWVRKKIIQPLVIRIWSISKEITLQGAPISPNLPKSRKKATEFQLNYLEFQYRRMCQYRLKFSISPYFFKLISQIALRASWIMLFTVLNFPKLVFLTVYDVILNAYVFFWNKLFYFTLPNLPTSPKMPNIVEIFAKNFRRYCPSCK